MNASNKIAWIQQIDSSARKRGERVLSQIAIFILLDVEKTSCLCCKNSSLENLSPIGHPLRKTVRRMNAGSSKLLMNQGSRWLRELFPEAGKCFTRFLWKREFQLSHILHVKIWLCCKKSAWNATSVKALLFAQLRPLLQTGWRWRWPAQRCLLCPPRWPVPCESYSSPRIPGAFARLFPRKRSPSLAWPPVW